MRNSAERIRTGRGLDQAGLVVVNLFTGHRSAP